MRHSLRILGWLLPRYLKRRPASVVRVVLAAFTVAAALACTQALYVAVDRTTQVVERLGSALNATRSIEVNLSNSINAPLEMLAAIPSDYVSIPLTQLPVKVLGIAEPLNLWSTDLVTLTKGTFVPGQAMVGPDSPLSDFVKIELHGKIIRLPLSSATGDARFVPQRGEILIDLSDAKRWWGSDSKPQRLLITATSTAPSPSIDALLKFLRESGFDCISNTERTVANKRLVHAYQKNLTLLLLLALVVATAAVYAAIEISAQQLKADLRVFQLLGMNPSTSAMVLFSEALVIATLGIVLGVTAATPLRHFVEHYIVESTGAYFKFSFSESSGRIGVESFVFSACIASLVAAAGSLLQARRVAKIPANLPSQHRVPLEFPRARAGSILALLALAALLLYFIPSIITCYLSVVALLIVGVWSAETVLAKATPLLLCWAKPLTRMVARGQLLSGYARLRGTVAALTIAFALLSGIVVMIESFRSSLSDWLGHSLRADLFIEPKTGSSTLSPHLIEQVRQQPYVQHVLEALDGESVIDGLPVVVAARDFIEIPILVAGAWDWQDWEDGELIALSEVAAHLMQRWIGSSITILGRTRKVGAILRDYSEQRPLVYISIGAYRRVVGAALAQRVSIVWRAEKTQQEQEGLYALLEQQDVRISSQRGLTNRALEIFDSTFGVTKILIWLAAAIAGFSLAMSLLQLSIERRIEYQALSTIGMSPHSLFRAVLLEGYCLVAAALIAGVSSGAILGFVLVQYVNPLSFGWSIDFRLDSVTLLTACLQAIGVMAIPMLAFAPWVIRTLRLRTQGIE